MRCNTHCVSCGACFNSIEAFDQHRTGSHENNTRRCRDVKKVKQLEPEPGLCNLARGSLTDRPVDVYHVFV